ncbi:MAG: ATP-binding protein [Sulfurimicrobium sp.]|nr:ATP-binding protein [Sulfurimicrobium sp.]MDP2197131.1 ATP-binding protein [Sulfurimicrobium sp.]MDP3689291.1 ATP-binding protein [Sulfurimicrobium sp.]
MALDRMTKLSWIYDLYQLGQSPQLLEEPDRIYQQLLVHIVAGFEARSGSLALIRGDQSTLTIVAGIDLPCGVVGSAITLGNGVLGWVAQQGQPLLINGDLDPQKYPGIQRQREQAAPSSALCWPLKLHDRVIGALSVNRPAEKAVFGESERDQGTAVLNLASLALENIQLQLDQQRRIAELQAANQKLAEAQGQLLQAEKMASIGQLAAGVAHEINNPVGYVASNLSSLGRYVNDLLSLLDACEQLDCTFSGDAPELLALRALKEKVNLTYLREDLHDLLAESKEGLERVKKIVLDLKTFSHVDEAEWQITDLHQGLESTLNIVWNELKYKAEVVKEYGTLQEIECLPSQLNQVFMNFMVNAAYAIESHGTITLRTGQAGEQVWVEVADTGKGIAPEHLGRIFDPFFTTKPVGKGTGLGLSLSYGIVKKHHGSIEVDSILGKGTTFRVWLPLRQAMTQENG